MRPSTRLRVCYSALVLACLGVLSQPYEFENLDMEEIQRFADETSGMLKKLACSDIGNNPLACLQYFLEYETDEGVVDSWFSLLNAVEAQMSNYMEKAAWDYRTNITDYSMQLDSDVGAIVAQYSIGLLDDARRIVPSSLDEQKQRILYLMLQSGTKRDVDKLSALQDVSKTMESIYSTGKVCHDLKTDGCLSLEPDLQDLMATSRDYDELLWAWQGWRDAVGPAVRDHYKTYVDLMNEISEEEGYHDAAEKWQSKYEDADFETEIDRLWEETRPMYLHLHAYVRRKLAQQYGEENVSLSEPIPAHLFGNMWSQQWGNIYDIVEPYPGLGVTDVTGKMVEDGWTVNKMFNVSNNFFTSLGLDPMPDSFWTKSMLTKPSDREVVCHASAWDFAKNRDVRIKMCAEVTMTYLYVIHHEMGHCEYYLQYSKQPMILRGGANPGFHEAVGDTIALSVVTPDYLHTIGLLDSKRVDKKKDINYLMKVALDKIAFLPFGLLIDKWRWGVFRGDITPDQYNKRWWQLRNDYQGIKPPVSRSSRDFDPGAKYHVVAGVPYIRYFVSFIIQFQFQEALCQAASNFGPLHLCNLYKSREAGAKLKSMLEMGQSKPWPEAMEKMTGGRLMDTGAIKGYFEPLMEWLKEQNDGEYIGWGDERIFYRNIKGTV